MPVAAKTAGLFWEYPSNKGNFQKIFEGETIFRFLPTPLLQIFCEFMLHSKLDFKGITDPDDISPSMNWSTPSCREFSLTRGVWVKDTFENGEAIKHGVP